MKPPDQLRHLYVDFNSFFASVEQQDQPHLRDKPVVVIPVDSEFTTCIAASIEAKQLGIRTGTSVREALQRCPDLKLIRASHVKYVAYHQRILAAIEQVLPIHAVCSIDEMDCLLHHQDQRPDQALMLAEAVRRSIRDNVGPYVRCSIGIAPNQLLAKMGTELQKPDGLVVIHPDQIPQIFYRLNLRDFCGIGPGMHHRLRQAHVDTVEQLYALSRHQMRQLWGGVVGERYYYHLHGYDLPPVATTRSSVSHSQVLSPGLREPETAYWVLRGLVVRVGARLRRQGLYATDLTVGYRTETRRKDSRWIRDQATQDTWTLLQRTTALWEQMADDIRHQRLKKVFVVASGISDQPVGQQSLFVEKSRLAEKHHKLSQALDHLHDRFGAQAVSIGWSPAMRSVNKEAKVAFNRVPDLSDYED